MEKATSNEILEKATLDAELHRLNLESNVRLQESATAFKMQCCVCDVLARIPWERVKHVCLSEGRFVTDADFYSVSDFVPAP